MRTRTKKHGKTFLRSVTAIAVAATMTVGGLSSLSALASTGSDGLYYSDFNSFADEQAYAKEYSVQMMAESIVLLKNENNVLPLRGTKNVTLFGNSSYYHVIGKNGGSADRTGYTMLPDALEMAGYKVNPKVAGIYNVYGPEYTYNFYSGTKKLLSNPLRLELPTEMFGNVEGSYSLYGDAAIVTISREGNEDVDMPIANVEGHDDETENALQLNDNERAMIQYMKNYFGKVIVLINSASTMDITELEDDPGVDAILWIGCPGMYGMEAVGQVLNGTVNPSGRTVDTYAADLTKNPVYYNAVTNYEEIALGGDASEISVEYEEDIYLGYKWYETAAADGVLDKIPGYVAADAAIPADKNGDMYYNRSTGVVYPFGYGLSYTQFKQEWVTESFAIPANATLDTFVDVKVKVTNTGTVEGKEVVQVYSHAPYLGGIEKAEVSLVSYGKTAMLAPGQSEVVTLSVRVGDIASFDYTNANNNGFAGYEIEAGDYELRLQKNSHEVIGKIEYSVETTLKLDNDDDPENNTPLSEGDDYDSLLIAEEEASTMKLLSRKNFVETFPTVPVSSETKKYGDNLVALLTETENEHSNYYSLSLDDADDPWYAASVPSDWTQATNTAVTTDVNKNVVSRNDGSKCAIQLGDMVGIDYTDESTPVKVNGTTYESGKAAWTAYLNQLNWNELVALCSFGGYGTYAVTSAGKPVTVDADGPERFGDDGTYLPCPTNQASTWNLDIAYIHGAVAAHEGMYQGVTGWYAPAFNIHRTPFCGRNRSYYSEDGVMAGYMAAATAKGAEDNGVYAFAKHFALNNQETSRSNLATWASEQAIREIYLKPFEYALKVGEHFGGARAIMTAMNRVGAVGCCGHYALLTDIVRGEWGFKGLVVSDSYKDGWPKANVMQRAGCDLPLGTYDGSNVIIGEWDDEIGVYYTDKDGNKIASPTQWTVIRNTAEHILWVTANSTAMGNNLDTSLFAEKFDNKTENLTAGVPVDIDLSVDFDEYGTDVVNYEIISGRLPNGLSIDATGHIVGRATETGTFEVTIEQLGSGWVRSDATMTFVVETLLDSSEGWTFTAGKDFSTTLSQDKYVKAAYEDFYKTGSIAKLEYELVDAANGLSMTTEGVLSGNLEAGTYDITVRLTYSKTESHFTKITNMEPQVPNADGQMGWARQSADVVIETSYTITVEEGKEEAEAVKSIASAAINDEGHLIVTYTDNTTEDLGLVVGASAEAASGCNGTVATGSVIAGVGLALLGVAGYVIIKRKKNNG